MSTRKLKPFIMLSWGRGVPGIGYRSALPQLIESSRICLPLLTGMPSIASSEESYSAYVPVEEMAFGFVTIRK